MMNCPVLLFFFASFFKLMERLSKQCYKLSWHGLLISICVSQAEVHKCQSVKWYFDEITAENRHF
jgi:hypothetical protein